MLTDSIPSQQGTYDVFVQQRIQCIDLHGSLFFLMPIHAPTLWLTQIAAHSLTLGRFLLLLFGYVLISQLTWHDASLFYGHLHSIRWAAGLGLTLLCVAGQSWWPIVLVGALIAGTIESLDFAVNLVQASSYTLEALLASGGLAKCPSTHAALRTPRYYLQISVIIAVSASMPMLGQWGHSDIGVWLEAWGSELLGLGVFVPLIILWRHWPQHGLNRERVFESLCCFAVQILIGQVLLVGWLPHSMGLLTQTYWLFLFVFWAAYRLGWQGVVLVVGIVGAQAFYGGIAGVGIFGSDWTQTYGVKPVLYLLSLLVAGLGFRMILNERDHEEAELRQLLEVVNSSSNPAILLDISQNFYYVNPAFEGLLGYSLAEIKGQSTHLILPPLDEVKVRDDSEEGASLKEEFLRTKKGQLIPVKMDFAPVKDKHNRLIGMVCNLTDLTEIQKILKAEFESKRQWLSLFNHMSNAFSLHKVLRNEEGHMVDYQFLEVNPAFEKMTGLSRDGFIGKNATHILPDWGHELIAHFANVVDTGIESHMDIYDKQLARWYSICAYSPTCDQFAVISEDITQRKQAEQALRLSASVFAHTRESITITDASGSIIDVNSAFTACTGYTRDEVLGKNPRVLSSGYQDSAFYQKMWQTLLEQGSWKGEVWNRTKEGEVYAAVLNIAAIKNDQDKITHFISLSTEITHIREHQKSLERMARHDALTGLPNRLSLLDRLQQAIETSRRSHLTVAVCYLDLDGFKAINDSLGHHAGDVVLVEVAKRLTQTVRQMDTVARLGGDEFVVLLLGQEQKNAFDSLLDRLLGVISTPIFIDQHRCSVGVSIGVSLFPQHAQDADALLASADEAMYVAKRQGKNRYAIANSRECVPVDAGSYC